MPMQAIILAAGHGSRVSELTHDRPKCLLPVGNNCLLWYAVTTLKQIGIVRIICLIPDKHESEIKQYCHKKFGTQKDLDLTFKTRPMDQDFGTADSLRLIADRIDGDFMIYSCDTIVEPSAITGLFNQYCLYDNSVTILLSDQSSLTNAQTSGQMTVPGSKEKVKLSKDIIALEPFDPRTCSNVPSNSDASISASEGVAQKQQEKIEGKIAKVVCLKSDSRDTVKFNLKLLWLHPELKVYSSYVDAHVYIFKKHILDLIKQDSKKTLKGEILPWLVMQQFYRPTVQKIKNKFHHHDVSIDDNNDSETDHDDAEMSGNEMILQPSQYKDTQYYERDLEEKLSRLEPNSGLHLSTTAQAQSKSLKCYAYIARENTLCLRANTIGSYMECNRQAKNLLAKLGAKPSVGPSGKPSIDTVFGECFTVGDKCILKKSCIGNNCKFGDKVKIIDSVIMDNVEIDSNVSISGSIVGSGCKIGQKCDLKSCLVGASQQVPASSRLSGESVMDDRYMIDFSAL